MRTTRVDYSKVRLHNPHTRIVDRWNDGTTTLKGDADFFHLTQFAYLSAVYRAWKEGEKIHFESMLWSELICCSEFYPSDFPDIEQLNK